MHVFLRYCGLLLMMFLAGAAPAMADEIAPDFVLPGRDQPVSLSTLHGKVVYLDFWASWCTPCRKSFPWMNTMQQRYGDRGLVIVAVNLDKERALAERFLKETPARFTISFDPEGKVAAAYKVRGMPSSYLIDPQGRIRSSHIGFRETGADDLEKTIQSLLPSTTAVRSP